jgi:hypothetical protein
VTGKMEEAIDHLLVTKEKTSHFHSNDLTRRLKKWADTIDLTQPIHSFTKQEIESYLARYSAQNFINHRAALSNLFGHALKIGATPENPVSGIEKPRIKRTRPWRTTVARSSTSIEMVKSYPSERPT